MSRPGESEYDLMDMPPYRPWFCDGAFIQEPFSAYDQRGNLHNVRVFRQKSCKIGLKDIPRDQFPKRLLDWNNGPLDMTNEDQQAAVVPQAFGEEQSQPCKACRRIAKVHSSHVWFCLVLRRVDTQIASSPGSTRAAVKVNPPGPHTNTVVKPAIVCNRRQRGVQRCHHRR